MDSIKTILINEVINKLNNVNDNTKAQIFLDILNNITTQNFDYLKDHRTFDKKTCEETLQGILQELIKKHIPETKNTEGKISTNKKYEKKYMKYKIKYLSLKKLFHS